MGYVCSLKRLSKWSLIFINKLRIKPQTSVWGNEAIIETIVAFISRRDLGMGETIRSLFLIGTTVNMLEVSETLEKDPELPRVKA